MAQRDTIVVVQKGDHSLGYYDFETGEQAGRVPLDPYPHEFVLTPDGRHAYMCHFGVALAEDGGPGGNTVSVVEVPARRRVGTVDCGDYRRPHGIDLDARGALYVLSEGTSKLLVIGDPLSGRVERAQPTAGEGSHILSVTPDGRVAFCSNMFSATVTAVFPEEPGRPPLAFPVGERPEGSVLDEGAEKLYVVARESGRVAVIDVKALKMLEPIATPPGPVRICWGAPDTLLVPLYHERALALVDRTRGVRQVVPLPDRPISIGYHAPSGTALASTFGDQVCLVDTAAARLVRTIPTRKDPDPVAVVAF
jgi:DNA-binding beta-propeller fold protein YncE